jgi:hypothetical protein
MDKAWASRTMEYAWHVIFGDEWRSNRPDPERLWPPSRPHNVRDNSPFVAGTVDVPLTSRWAPSSDVTGGTVLVVASFGEDSSWVEQQPFPYVIVTKGLPEGTPNNVPFNKAQEADGYLAFILQNYDDLPPRMIFCHNHNKAWHIDGVCCRATAL